MDEKTTPMLRQYLDIKEKHRDDILFFRLGDFYEMFFDDAIAASRALDIALTKRHDMPMCGIPYHAAESYIARLVKAGFRIAVCEQTESVPSEGKIVKREVVRVITPGTVVESNILQGDENNFLGSVAVFDDAAGCAFLDISTGELFVSECAKTEEAVLSVVGRYRPREIIYRSLEKKSGANLREALERTRIPIASIHEWLYEESYLEKNICSLYGIVSAKPLGLTSAPLLFACGAVLEYAADTHKKRADFIKYPRVISRKDFMVLDSAARSNLEIVTGPDGTRRGTLFEVLNKTVTAMGRRLLEATLLEPLVDREKIESRLDHVAYFYHSPEACEEALACLRQVQDLERFVARFSLGRVFPRDYIALASSLNACALIKKYFCEKEDSPFKALWLTVKDLSALTRRILSTICDEPATSPEQGRVIREGADAECDRLHAISKDSRDWILKYEDEEKQRLGITALKVRYNKVHGYYIEIPKGSTSKAPDEYLRKQTLVGAERYTTEKLQAFETDILGAHEKIVAIETAILASLREAIVAESREIQATADASAESDLYLSLARCAKEYRYVRPHLNDRGSMRIHGARHPVVERTLREPFIPNDIEFDATLIKIITGPNMSGKSTYMRMAAVVQLMAQAGSFVPADSADICIVDRIFTRIGASDNIARGESTFLVEMNETATILNNATERSLIIMDEVGRGTSTWDGLAIARAIIEYLASHVKAKTFFATHYHELTTLESIESIANYTVLVKESARTVEFLHRVIRGAADRSYGIHVARLAGIPSEVTRRAGVYLKKYESAPARDAGDAEQISLFSQEAGIPEQVQSDPASEMLRGIDINSITPLDAFNLLVKIKESLPQ